VVGDLTPSHGIRLAAPLEKALLRLGAFCGLDFVGHHPQLDIGSGASLALPCLAPFGPVLALGGHRLLAAAHWPCAGLALAFDLALCWPRFLRF